MCGIMIHNCHLSEMVKIRWIVRLYRIPVIFLTIGGVRMMGCHGHTIRIIPMLLCLGIIPFRDVLLLRVHGHVRVLRGHGHVSLGISVLDGTPSIDNLNHIILISGIITLSIIRTWWVITLIIIRTLLRRRHRQGNQGN